MNAAASPRTAELPMAFTPREFVRGALMAWAWFLILSTVFFIPLFFVWFWFPAMYTVPFSLAALMIGSIPAYALGLALRGIAAVPVHLAAFTVFGLIVGVATTSVALPLLGMGSSTWGEALLSLHSLAVILAATVAVPLGWWHTARRALHPSSEASPAQAGPDELFEEDVR